MESCFDNKLDRGETVVVDDLKKDLFSDFKSEDPSLEEREHLQVYLRIRPFTAAESVKGRFQDYITMETPDTVLLKAPSSTLASRLSDKSVQTGQRFQFSQVYGPETTQKEMFDGTVKSLVRDVLEGGNSLVFTYGVTNAGKTFTFLGHDANVGILPRSLKVIFSSIEEERLCTQMSMKPQRCTEFVRLTKDQQSEEAAIKRNLLKHLKESDTQKSFSSQSSTSKTSLEATGDTVLDMEGTEIEDTFSLDVDKHTKFSIWVSFCEIYNENIHNLLEPISSGASKRASLRLCQDVKGNSFVKDLRWVQVSSADEAYKVMKLGKKNQSISSTKLNQLSSRSHSIFSIRIIRIEDVGTPRVQSISELSLCDLAGSERCARTQNQGERLKEAGNINTSLLTLGKCITALRNKQQSKLLQHVPFRESKLTHYLQGYFCGRGKACMIVNINQCASMYDETLNVLKFSAVAQKVVVLTTKPLPVGPRGSARELSMIINNADRKALWATLNGRRTSSMVSRDSSLEDVQEDEDGRHHGDEEEEEESVMEETQRESEDDEEEDEEEEDDVVDKKNYKEQLKKAESLALEARIREEVTNEFSELFAEMQNDYDERLAKETEIIEDRAERRLEILTNLMSKNTNHANADKSLSLDGMIDSMCDDLAGIKEDAVAFHGCLGAAGAGAAPPRPSACGAEMLKKVSEMAQQLRQAQELLCDKTAELENNHQEAQKSHKLLEENKKICSEKNEIILKLQASLDQHLEAASKDRSTLDSVRAELARLKSGCTCSRGERPATRMEARKRLGEDQPDLAGQPPPKKGFPGDCGEGADEEAKGPSAASEEERREEERRETEPEGRAGSRGQRHARPAHLQEDPRVRELTRALAEATAAREEASRGLREEASARARAAAALGEEKRARADALAALEYQTHGREEALAALEEERRGREEAMAALEEERRGREEALAALEEERRGREEAMAALEEERRGREEALAALEEERRGREEALAALEEERRGREEAMAALEEERRGREEALAALEEERRGKGEALAAALKEQNRENSRLTQKTLDKGPDSVSLLKESRDLGAKLEAALKEVGEQTESAAKSSAELGQAQAQLQGRTREVQEKTALILSLTHEVQHLQQQAEAGAPRPSSAAEEEEEVMAGLRKALSEAAEESERRQQQALALERELSRVNEELSQTRATAEQAVEQREQQQLSERELASEQRFRQLQEKLNERELGSAQQVRELTEQLCQQRVIADAKRDQLEHGLAELEAASQRGLEELRRKLKEQESRSEKLTAELQEKLTEQALTSEERAEELGAKLGESLTSHRQLDQQNEILAQQKRTVEQQLEELRDKLLQQEQVSDQLRGELEEARAQVQRGNGDAAAMEELKKLNSDLRDEVTPLRAKVTAMEEKEAEGAEGAEQRRRCLQEKEEEAAAAKLAEKEALVSSLQKSLRDAQERREEEESQAVKEARRREVERRRELLAVAEEAIAQKDAELEKRAQEITRLKEAAQRDAARLRSLTLDLQRREDDAADGKEKLADSKRQIQQVQKEISSMREEERALRQKLQDLEKAKKQLHADVATRDRTILQLKSEPSSNAKADQLYQKACQDLQERDGVIEGMRAALTEQEETQDQMDQVLEEKLEQIQELADEVEKLKGLLSDRQNGPGTPLVEDVPSDSLGRASRVTEPEQSMQLCVEKHQAERRKWLEEKMTLIHHAKEAQDKRNQEMRKFAEDRERHARQQSQLESLSAQLGEKDRDLLKWRQERDGLVSALEVQLKKLLGSNAEKDRLIEQLRCSGAPSPPEGSAARVEELQAALSDMEAEVASLKEQLALSSQTPVTRPPRPRSTASQPGAEGSPAAAGEKPRGEVSGASPGGSSGPRASVSSQGSGASQSVLDWSQISTENGRASRFPKPELEICFSPLQPNRMALRRQGDASAVTVKISRSARKRRSGEMEKNKGNKKTKAKERKQREEVDSENRRNTRTRLTPKLTPHQEEGSPAGSGMRPQGSQSSVRSRKEGALQKIGDFLHSSPTLFGTKAKKIMGLVSSRCEENQGGLALSSKPKKGKRNPHCPEISSPMDVPAHSFISRDAKEKDDDNLILKRRFRTRTAK